jgi:hypothetical protein
MTPKIIFKLRYASTKHKVASGKQVTDANMASSSDALGLYQFISHAELAPNYLKNDALYFEVLSIV